eukprot:CAMPEP_0180754138 /NCGR_PEP_ID=MMETSP1038_2-20121128/33038_1 /TAXON_ID=632150 /ORGANISM="Azadinium spinosum, Strain 3D9" /LENGTH=108 /DNA_ID=CAMNT_0022788035 /DNA_START=54 /DNA_END=377 /DNA_ORIENTATION=+
MYLSPEVAISSYYAKEPKNTKQVCGLFQQIGLTMMSAVASNLATLASGVISKEYMIANGIMNFVWAGDMIRGVVSGEFAGNDVKLGSFKVFIPLNICLGALALLAALD